MLTFTYKVWNFVWNPCYHCWNTEFFPGWGGGLFLFAHRVGTIQPHCPSGLPVFLFDTSAEFCKKWIVQLYSTINGLLTKVLEHSASLIADFSHFPFIIVLMASQPWTLCSRLTAKNYCWPANKSHHSLVVDLLSVACAILPRLLWTNLQLSKTFSNGRLYHVSL